MIAAILLAVITFKLGVIVGEVREKGKKLSSEEARKIRDDGFANGRLWSVKQLVALQKAVLEDNNDTIVRREVYRVLELATDWINPSFTQELFDHCHKKKARKDE